MNLFILALTFAFLALTTAAASTYQVDPEEKENVLSALKNICLSLKFASALLIKDPLPTLTGIFSAYIVEDPSLKLTASPINAGIFGILYGNQIAGSGLVESILNSHLDCNGRMLAAYERISELVQNDQYDPENFYFILSQPQHHPLQKKALQASRELVTKLLKFKERLATDLPGVKNELEVFKNSNSLLLLGNETCFLKLKLALRDENAQMAADLLQECVDDIERLRLDFENLNFDGIRLQLLKNFGSGYDQYYASGSLAEPVYKSGTHLCSNPSGLERLQSVFSRLLDELKAMRQAVQSCNHFDFLVDPAMNVHRSIGTLSRCPEEIVAVILEKEAQQLDAVAPLVWRRSINAINELVKSLEEMLNEAAIGKAINVDTLKRATRITNVLHPTEQVQMKMFF